MRYPRPVPVIGDRTSALDRAADPGAWAFPDDQREAARAVMAARRDIRRYRPDPVPDEVLRRVLAAGHTAPSVGHSQPWRFLVVRDPALRDRAALLAEEQKLAQAEQMEPDAARRLRDLKLDGIRDAPLGVVVCCDRRTHAAGVLGRATFPDADLWSCAAAVQNMWLASRAEGLGMGWVTLFRPEDLAALIGLPDGVETLGWLCLGWPDERPPDPGLERRGWSKRLPLDEVVLTDRWPAADGGRPAGPAAPPSHLRAPGREDVVAARDAGDQLLAPPEALGVLDAAVDRLLAAGVDGTAEGEFGELVLVGADHPVAELGVSAYPVAVTRDVAEAAVAGDSIGATAARAAGLGVTVVDAGIAGGPLRGAAPARPEDPRGDLVDGDALTAADCARLVEHGRALGRRIGAGGRIAVLGEVGVGNTTPAAALAAAFTGLPVAEAVGLGSGADAAMLDRKRAVAAAAVARIGGDGPWDAVRAAGGPEFAVLAGVVLGTAEAGGAVVLDGLATSVAALAAVRVAPGAAARLIAGQRSRERAHGAVLGALGLEPLLDLRLRAGEGAGGCLAAGLLRVGLRVRGTAARTH